MLISADFAWQDDEVRTLRHEMDQRGVDVIPVMLVSGPVPEALADRAVVDMTQPETSISDLAERIDSGRSLSLLDLRHQEFEGLVRDLLASEGFGVDLPTEGDYGYDLSARLPGARPGEEVEYLVELKAYRSGRVSVSTLHEAFGRFARIGSSRKVLIVTNGQLTSVATKFLADLSAQPNTLELTVIDGVELKYRLLNHPELVRKYSRRAGGAGERP